MKAYEATSVIDASPDAIWAILTDAPGYQRWDSGVEQVGGRIAWGEKIEASPAPTPAAPSRCV
jgi:Polyketide cyclase / dehydrase and lipid transport